jgi:hypothetical protein
MTPEEIQEAKKLNKPKSEIYNMFMNYCRDKGIGIYSKDVFHEILKLFPKDEDPDLYQYCIWMFDNQID